MIRPINLFLILLILLPALIFARESGDQEYRISKNDLLEIMVYEELDLSKTVRVSSDETISYPLLGSISVAGLTTKELEAKLTELLAKKYLVSPQVTVFIKEFSKVSVLGQVKNPGSYELKSGLRVIEAIALAGGFTDNADPTKIKLSRIKGGQIETINIDSIETVENLDKGKNMILEPNDVIVVEERVMISVVGQVRNPGRYILKKDMMVIEAIALAGGLTDTAAADRTQVIRKQDGKEKIIRVPVGSIFKSGDKTRDILLKANDTIVVPESIF